MKSNISSDIFIDLSKIICQSEIKCKNETKNGDLISYDGNHLTDKGAIFVGERLSNARIIKEPNEFE